MWSLAYCGHFTNLSCLLSALGSGREPPEAYGKSRKEPCVGSCPHSEQKRQPRPTAKKGGREEGGGRRRPRGRRPQTHASLQLHVYPLYNQPVSMACGQGRVPGASAGLVEVKPDGRPTQWVLGRMVSKITIRP